MKWLGPALVVLIAVLAELIGGRTGHGPDAALFFGRFHPLVVHLPIGFFLLVAAGEAATFHPRLRERVEPALGLLVPISAAAALGAFLMGQLLALEGGFPAQALINHRRLTLLAVIGMAACWVLFERQHAKSGQGRWLYRGAMGATLGLLSLGAHFGGTMTRGEAYLSKYAPDFMKPLLGAPEPKAPAEPVKAVPAGAEPLVFADVVQPILNEHCVECHGADKQKGKLRLDSLDELMKGGENGATVVAGQVAKSPLLQRMLLPVSDDDRMPPEGKPSPKPEALALIEFWIERGASATLKVKDVLAPTVSRALLEHAAGGAAKPATLPGAAAAPAPADSAAAAPADSIATAPAEKPATERSTDAGSTTKAAAAEPADKAEPATAPEPAAVTQPASAPATDAALSGSAFLSTYCVKCHGPSKQKGKLRVDSLAAMLKGGADGPALVPGSPDKSSLVTRLRLPVGNDEHMPPAKETQPSAAQVAAFASWVRSGAGGAVTAASKPAQPSTSLASATSASAISDTTTSAAATEPAAAPVSEPAAAPAPQLVAATPGTAPAAAGPPDPALLKSLPSQVALFNDAVQPLLREKCGKCHISDKPAGGLDVAKHAAMLEGGYSGAGIVPGDRKKSVLFGRIVLPATDDERMPPEGEPALTPDEVELIGEWIDQGAPSGGATPTAKLSGGAVRALSALGVKSGPEPLAAQAGGCAACSVPGTPLPRWLAAQSLSLFAAAMLVAWRRRAARRA
jgi:uncharacterized membrane protein